METQQAQIEETPALYAILKILMANPCLILVLGDWRTGKTNVALLLSHLAKAWGLIDRIGANIFCYDNPDVDYIISMGRLKRWLHVDASIKLFDFDEALTHLPSRRAMSKKNVDVVAMIAELSKGHGRIIFCAQTDKVDSSLKDSAFLRAIIYTWKSKKDGYCMRVVSKLFETQDFTHLPRSPIKFDQDRLADWQEIDMIPYTDLAQEMQCATLYAQGITMNKIAKKLGLNDNTVRRNVQKVLKQFFKREGIKVFDNKDF